MTGDLSNQSLSIPPGRFVPVYVTAKRHHSDKLLALRDLWPHIYFTMRWPVVRNVPSEAARPAVHWVQDNADDIERSEYVICDSVPEDDLNGSIFELGIAWRAGKTIYLVGDNERYKEWKFAARVLRRGTLEQVLEEITASIAYRVNDAERIIAAIAALGK